MFIDARVPKGSSSLQRSETDLRIIAGSIALRWSAGRAHKRFL
jgi:hypothetical protein